MPTRFLTCVASTMAWLYSLIATALLKLLMIFNKKYVVDPKVIKQEEPKVISPIKSLLNVK